MRRIRRRVVISVMPLVAVEELIGRQILERGIVGQAAIVRLLASGDLIGKIGRAVTRGGTSARNVGRSVSRGDRRGDVRRVTFDLTGLPPTPLEVDSFVHDARPDAYERAVDRLLGSEHFGERWARWWLDLAHYGDSDGYLQDFIRPGYPVLFWNHEYSEEPDDREMLWEKFARDFVSFLKDVTAE